MKTRTIKDGWKKILNSKPRLTEREARAMLRTVVKIRSEPGYGDIIIYSLS